MLELSLALLTVGRLPVGQIVQLGHPIITSLLRHLFTTL